MKVMLKLKSCLELASPALGARRLCLLCPSTATLMRRPRDIRLSAWRIRRLQTAMTELYNAQGCRTSSPATAAMGCRV